MNIWSTVLMQYNHLINYKALSLISISLKFATWRATGLNSFMIYKHDIRLMYSLSLKLSNKTLFNWKYVIVKSKRSALLWDFPSSSFSAGLDLSPSKDFHRHLHSSIAYLRPCIDKNSDLKKFKSTMLVMSLSFPTIGSHSLSWLYRGSNLFL